MSKTEEVLNIDELYDQIDYAWIELNLDAWSEDKVAKLISLNIKLHEVTNV